MKQLISVDTRNFENTLVGWERDKLPQATANALNGVATQVRRAIRGSMQLAFDRPTKFTLNSTYMKAATKSNLVAEVRLKDVNAKGTPPSVYLAPEVYGGPRQMKRSEVLLQQRGVLPGGMFIVPGSEAKLDRYGNVSRGQLLQILSATKAFTAAGFSANRTGNSFDRSKTKLELFVGKPAGGRDPLGVYQRTSSGGLKPLLIFVSQPHYKPLLPFDEIAATVYVSNFQDEFNRALRDALILTTGPGLEDNSVPF